jgi:deazaflavin-dependent oxidoreductase (nitroreductase family)
MALTQSLADAYLGGLNVFARTRTGKWYIKHIAPHVDPPLLTFTGGRVSSIYPIPTMLLTTIGARSGQRRTHPVVYLVDDTGLIIVGSNFGSTRQPAWYHNLRANPKVDVLASGHTGSYMASEITEPDARDRAWALAVEMAEVWSDYEASAGDRTIPLIRLAPVSA